MADAAELFWGDCVPGICASVEQIIVVCIRRVTEVVTSQVAPESLDGVELGAVRRQVQQADILRNLQCPGRVPAGLIQHQDHLDIRACPVTDEPQVVIHVFGIDRRRQQRG